MLARTPKDIGLLIKDRRLSLGLQQRELAERVGVSRQWLVEVEHGKPRAEVGLILRTLSALGLVLDISGSGSPVANNVAPAVDLDDVINRARGKKR